ncbi:hypothetical protein [Catalinimonas niigatensis]|uniref:hypothetical protein n=1 Tax=Catalinimonas niigatensis TaxID=1397264 RepID=UPI0026650CB6|nr:hypothetical protein [Catalinimonas niigatensis]WPP51303.1 hypothetical protein PZB72_02725 [Catalinimonas niigatensis]
MQKFILLFLFSLVWKTGFSQETELIRQYAAPNASQAVAVDNDHFYAIGNQAISKHQKTDGKMIAEWKESEGIIKHLNNGAVIDGLLYCANSNYPESPMASSIEVFDTKTMTHVDSHSLGILIGSATWIDRYDDAWWIGFAHYSNHASSEGKDNRWTTVVKFDDKWQRSEGWIFPKDLVEQFSPSSNSGAVWGKDGKLYCTGHDAQKLYVMQLPDRGYTLEHIETIKIPFEGQGIAWDTADEKVMYGISRKNRQVLVVKLP